MSDTRNIASLVQQLAKDPRVTPYSVTCTVDSVDKNANTCDVTPLDESGELFDVALTQNDDKSLICYPAIGSTVAVTFLGKNTAFVSQFGEIESYLMANGNDSLFKILDDILQALLDIKLQTNYGPTTAVITAATITAIKNRLPQFFHQP